MALDPDTKLIPAHRVGKRDLGTATAFLCDLSERLTNRVQLSSDALTAYVEATEQAFGADVDYGQAVKFYEADPIGPGRYSPPYVVRQEKATIAGRPDEAHISTSMVERQNLTMRMSMRRFTRLANGFSNVEAQHGGHAKLVHVIPIRETFCDRLVWEGVVHVFGLEGHPKATRAYAWSSPIEGSEKRRFFAVLQLGAITSPLDAVRAAIVAEHRDRKTTP